MVTPLGFAPGVVRDAGDDRPEADRHAKPLRKSRLRFMTVLILRRKILSVRRPLPRGSAPRRLDYRKPSSRVPT